MNDKISKRNRSGNFDQDDIDLFLNLVNDHKALIESNKQEDKKKGWDLIHECFNNNCTGIRRDVSALKMKLKNLKALNKKVKLNESGTKLESLDETQESEHDVSAEASGNDQSARVPRKRSKMFSPEETALLQELVEQHFYCLDNSLTRDSLELRNKAWATITEEFNKAQVNDIQRDITELKTKHKNMKAQRLAFKSESEGRSTVDEIESDMIAEESLDERKLRSKDSGRAIINITKQSPPSRLSRFLKAPAASSYKKKSIEAILDGLDPSCDYSDEDDYPLTSRKQLSTASSDEKELERIRKENLLLKNSVLRKKERLLEIQIALAERNLRRHQL